MHLACQLLAQQLADLQYFIVERRRFVMLVHRVDGRDDCRRSGEVALFYQPQRDRAGPDQVPVRVGQNRTLQGRMMVGIFEDDLCIAVDDSSHDTFE